MKEMIDIMPFEKARKMFEVLLNMTTIKVKKDLYRTAWYAIDKQMPKKPEAVEELDDAWEKLIFSRWICPSCGHETQKNVKFCLTCGQRLDWSDEK